MTKHPKITHIVGILALILSAVLVGSGWYMLDYALLPDDIRQKDATSLDFLRKEYPGTVEWMDSMRQAGALRDTFIVGRSGRQLHALYAPCDSARATVVLVHGYTDNAVRMMMLGKVYHHDLRFNILLPDHEYHGQSQGIAVQMGWLDRINVERWTAIADSLWKVPIYLHGISMGAATVMMCSGDNLPASVKGIIEDCGYTSVWDEFESEIHNQFGLPAHPIMDIASILCRWRYGWDFDEASALKQVHNSTKPMLFIHGSADTFVPTHMVYQLYAAKQSGYKHLWIAPGSAHAQSFKDYREQYIGEITDFIRITREHDAKTPHP